MPLSVTVEEAKIGNAHTSPSVRWGLKMAEKGKTTYGNSWEGREVEWLVFTQQDHALVQSVRRAGFPSTSQQDPDCTGQTQTTEKILCSQEGDCLSTETLSALPQDFMKSSSLFSDRRLTVSPGWLCPASAS